MVCQSIRYYADKLPSHVVGKELVQPHYRAVVFAAEPSAALSDLGAADVAGVSSWHLLAGAVVLPQAIFGEQLRKADLEEAAISTDGKGLHAVEQMPCVNDVKERYLLLPNPDHRVVKRHDELLSFALRVIM